MVPEPGDWIRVTTLHSRKRFVVKEVTSNKIVHAFELEGQIRGKLRTFMASEIEVVKKAEA